MADPLADAYAVSLPAVDLLTTALFITHLLVQLPAGRGADRFGARTVALVAIGATVAGNRLLLVDDALPFALLGRAIVGIGSGAGFIAGLDLVRAEGGGPVLQGLYGGASSSSRVTDSSRSSRSPSRPRSRARPPARGNLELLT